MKNREEERGDLRRNDMIRHWPKLGRKAAHLWRWGSKGKVGQVMQMMRHFYLALSVGGRDVMEPWV